MVKVVIVRGSSYNTVFFFLFLILRVQHVILTAEAVSVQKRCSYAKRQ